MSHPIIHFNHLDKIDRDFEQYLSIMKENPYSYVIFDLNDIMRKSNYLDVLNVIHQKFNDIYIPLFNQEDILFNDLMNPLYIAIIDFCIKNNQLEKQQSILKNPIFLQCIHEYCDATCVSSRDKTFYSTPSFISENYKLFSKILVNYQDNTFLFLKNWIDIFNPHLQKINPHYHSQYLHTDLSQSMLLNLFKELIDDNYEKDKIEILSLKNKPNLEHLLSQFDSYSEQSFEKLSMNIANFLMFPGVYEGYSQDQEVFIQETQWLFDFLAPLCAPHWQKIQWHMALGIQLIDKPNFLNYLVEKKESYNFLFYLITEKFINTFLDSKTLSNKIDNALFYLINETQDTNLFSIKGKKFHTKKFPKTYLLWEKIKLENINTIKQSRVYKNKL